MFDFKLIILSAPSGAGKTTVARHLLASALNLGFSVSACSRPKREKEADGVDYHFLTADQFRKKIEEGAFLEWEEVYPDHFYGTLRAEVDRLSGLGHHVLFDVDVNGGLNIKKHYGNRALSVFIMPPSLEVLRERLEKRSSDSPEKIWMRLEKAQIEMSQANLFDRIVVNKELEQTLHDAFLLVKKFLDEQA